MRYATLILIFGSLGMALMHGASLAWWASGVGALGGVVVASLGEIAFNAAEDNES